jgi:hypothetical protein
MSSVVFLGRRPTRDTIRQTSRNFECRYLLFAPQRIGHDFQLLVGRLGYVQEQHPPAANQAVPTAVAAKPILPNFETKLSGRVERLI